MGITVTGYGQIDTPQLASREALEFERASKTIKTDVLLYGRGRLRHGGKSLTLCNQHSNTQYGKRYIFKTDDNHQIETGLYDHPMEPNKRWQDFGIEVSTQIGCAQGCIMCASSQVKYKRNLTADELVSQVEYVLKAEGLHPERANSFFFSSQGIGEPSLNAENFALAAETLRNRYPNLAVHIATMGTNLKAIKFWADRIPEPFKLYISLHGSNQEVRGTIIKAGRRRKLEDLLGAVDYFYAKRSQCNIVLNYIPMSGLNDNDENLRELLESDVFVSRRDYITFKFLVLNSTTISQVNKLESTSLEKIHKWVDLAQSKGFTAYSICFGAGIKHIACGQLLMDQGEERILTPDRMESN